MQSLHGINKRYPEIFGSDIGDSEEVGRTTDKLFRKFGWVTVLDRMAEGDPMKYSYYEGLNVLSFLNLLRFKIVQAAEVERQRVVRESLAKGKR